MAKHFAHWTEAAAEFRSQAEPFVLITLLDVRGSAPREAGTKMLISVDTLVGTIGGGHLEHSVIAKARQLLSQPGDQQHIEQYPLGPKLGQCCGGKVTVLFECFNEAAAHIAVFGAGHVGRALVSILAQLPLRVTWLDSRSHEFPEHIPAGVEQCLTDSPEVELSRFPAGTYYVVMTHLHPLDYAITEAVLKRKDAAYLGIIGSQTKAKRFQMRLKHRGFEAGDISFMHCPVGLNTVPGKHPMEVAVSIAAELIGQYHQTQRPQTSSAEGGTKLLAFLNQNEPHE